MEKNNNLLSHYHLRLHLLKVQSPGSLFGHCSTANQSHRHRRLSTNRNDQRMNNYLGIKRKKLHQKTEQKYVKRMVKNKQFDIALKKKKSSINSP